MQEINLSKRLEDRFSVSQFFIFTANRGDIDYSLEGVEIHLKGDFGYYELLDRVWNIYETGLTHIMGSRGKMEELLSKVFKKNIFPQIDKWIKHSERDGRDKTKRALMRYTLSHLYHLLERWSRVLLSRRVLLISTHVRGYRNGEYCQGEC